MQRLRLFFLIQCLLLVLSQLAAVDIRDRLLTVDGEIVSGRIIERYPGVEYHIETRHGLLVIPEYRIEWIEKTLPDPDDDLFVYTDIIYLKTGLMLSGTILAEQPQEEITVLSRNGAAITLPFYDIWRITHEKRAAMIPAEDIEKNTRVQNARRDLAIELTVRRLESEEKKKEDGKDTDSVQQLRDELEDLREENTEAAAEAEKDEEYVAQLLEEISGTDQEAAEALTELARRAGACAADNPEGMARIADLYMTSISGIEEIGMLAETLNDIDPGIIRQVRQAEETAMRAELSALILGSLRNPYASRRITELARNLPEQDRKDVFRKAKQREPFNAALLNGLVPIGAGSMKQGDKLGVAIQAGTLIVGGLLVLDSLAGSELENNDTLQLSWSGWLGAGIGGAGYAYSLFRPFQYASRQNALSRRLLLLEGVENEK